MIEDTIAILMTTYNGESFINDQIDSIIKQSNTNWVLYISDDCSTDETLDIIRRYCDEYPGKIINLNNKKRYGNARDHFFGMIRRIEANYYMLSDQDDVWERDKIKLSFDRMQQLESRVDKAILIHTDLKVVDRNLSLVSESFAEYCGIAPTRYPINTQLILNFVIGCTTMFNATLRELFILHTLLEQKESPIIMHDWWLALIAGTLGTIDYLEEPTVLYRQHGKNLTGLENRKSIRYAMKKIRINDTRRHIYSSMKQAEYFCTLYEDLLSSEIRKLINEYSRIRYLCKLDRIMFYMKTKTLKPGFARKLMQIVQG